MLASDWNAPSSTAYDSARTQPPRLDTSDPPLNIRWSPFLSEPSLAAFSTPEMPW